MTGIDDIPDDILGNILSRLPLEPMAGRCRCVSRRWNALISDPNFMLSRSPKIFLLGTYWSYDARSIYTLDESRESVTELDFSMFYDIPTFVKDRAARRLTIVGTLSGIILLVLTDHDRSTNYMDEHMILYNPLTGVYDVLPDPHPPFYYDIHAYGFGYGATTVDELKIVRFRNHRSKKKWNTCDVFDLKTGSWSHPEVLIDQDTDFQDADDFQHLIGTFLKGYLYWMDSSVFNVDKMVFSEMHLPDSAINKYNHLGTCHGCLWMITNTAVKTLNFDVWVMNEQAGVDNSWSKTCSLTIRLEPQTDLRIIEITEEGRILIFINVDLDRYENMIIIYDTSKHSYKSLETPEEILRGIKYKESLISPMNICRV